MFDEFYLVFENMVYSEENDNEFCTNQCFGANTCKK